MSTEGGLPLDGTHPERSHEELKSEGGSQTNIITRAQHIAKHIESAIRTGKDLDWAGGVGRLGELDEEELLAVSSIVSQKTNTRVRFY